MTHETKCKQLISVNNQFINALSSKEVKFRKLLQILLYAFSQKLATRYPTIQLRVSAKST